MDTTIKTFNHPNGLVRVMIFQRQASPTALFGFCEEGWREFENPGTGEPYSYWLPIFGSGHYDSAAAAEADARAMFSWLPGDSDGRRA